MHLQSFNNVSDLKIPNKQFNIFSEMCFKHFLIFFKGNFPNIKHNMIIVH